MKEIKTSKTPIDFYNHYKIYQGLQLHQLRAAAVGKYVCDRMTRPVDSNSVIVACLFHDMGNIIKSSFNEPVFASLAEPEGVDYWLEVKKEFIEKYGEKVSPATRAICIDMKLPEKVIALIDEVGFSNMPAVLATSMYEMKIVEYADLRVGPFGILSLQDRIEDGRRRYRARMLARGFEPESHFDLMQNQAHEVERSLVAASDFRPEVITDESLAPLIEELKSYPIQTL